MLSIQKITCSNIVSLHDRKSKKSKIKKFPNFLSNMAQKMKIDNYENILFSTHITLPKFYHHIYHRYVYKYIIRKTFQISRRTFTFIRIAPRIFWVTMFWSPSYFQLFYFAKRSPNFDNSIIGNAHHHFCIFRIEGSSIRNIFMLEVCQMNTVMAIPHVKIRIFSGAERNRNK